MKVIEYGSRQAPLMTIFQCTAEPWWVFKPSAEELSGEFHILLFAADGHDESGTTFESVEKYAHDAAEYLATHGYDHVDLMYGVSLGGIHSRHKGDHRRGHHTISVSKTGLPADCGRRLSVGLTRHKEPYRHGTDCTAEPLDAGR